MWDCKRLFLRFTANIIQCLNGRIIFIGIWCLSIMYFKTVWMTKKASTISKYFWHFALSPSLIIYITYNDLNRSLSLISRLFSHPFLLQS